MPNAAPSITAVHFHKYKALRQLSLRLHRMSVLVGPNNAGKSTVLGAFRLLSLGLRTARARRPEILRDAAGRRRPGYVVATAGSTVSLENVHTDLADADTTVTFDLSNGNRLQLFFPTSGGCLLFVDGAARTPGSPSAFRETCPVTVAHVPVLGPVEHGEPLLRAETVRAALETHRAARHFRNFWHHEPEDFDRFAALLAETWPGMEIEPPEIQWGAETTLAMFCRESRMTRELYWAGFGFQVWCQLLTHLLRGEGSTLLVLDEPEIYLHPALQRQLVHVLRSLRSDVLLATHATELLAEVDPGEVVVLDKRRRHAMRLATPREGRRLHGFLGISDTPTLIQLARHPRVVLVEAGDVALLQSLARVEGLRELANGEGVTMVPLREAATRGRVEEFVAAAAEATGERVDVVVVLSRGARAAGELARARADLAASCRVVEMDDHRDLEEAMRGPLRAAQERLTTRATGWRAAAAVLRRDEIPADVRRVLRELERFRVGGDRGSVDRRDRD